MFGRLVGSLIHRGPNWLNRSSLMTKPNVVFVLGGPGAGKGTQCSKTVEVGERKENVSGFGRRGSACRHEIWLSYTLDGLACEFHFYKRSNG